MATLTLTVLRCPEFVTAEQRQVRGGELTIGRGAECDWPLPDPDKSLSRKHCTLEFLGGAWQVRDLSSNGTFVNHATVPIGRDMVQTLRSGDRLRLGDYEIELRIEEMQPVVSPSALPGLGDDAQASPFGSPVRPSFGSARLPGLDDPVPGAGLAPAAAFGQVPAPPFGYAPAAPFGGAVADHVPASAAAFVPPVATPAPAAGTALVPDDWLDSLLHDAAPRPAPAPVPPAAVPRPVPVPAPPSPRAMSEFDNATALPVRPAASPVPAVDLSLSTLDQTVPPQPQAPAPAAATAPGSLKAALNTLLAGGEITPDMAARALADPETTLRNAGALLHASVAGLRALLISRWAVKREFRIEQTMLRTRENNPLKFAASDEQALTALLDPRTPGLQAVRDSVADLTTHQVAVLAATQAAARALLEQLEPARLEAEDKGGGLLPGSAEKRLWQAYKSRHAKLIEQFEDDFESAFGKAFARAYEEAVGRGKG